MISVMLNKTVTALGFDFGMKHIGVAVGQTITQTANPLTTLKAKLGTPDWKQVAALVNEWHPQVLVVGIPLNMDGSEQALTHAARRFANQLKKQFNLPVEHADERLTTREAKQDLFDQGGYKALQKHKIDSYSAKIILESWFRQR